MRPFNTNGKAATEDKQPNESINKRTAANPPTVRPSQPWPRYEYRGPESPYRTRVFGSQRPVPARYDGHVGMPNRQLPPSQPAYQFMHHNSVQGNSREFYGRYPPPEGHYNVSAMHRGTPSHVRPSIPGPLPRRTVAPAPNAVARRGTARQVSHPEAPTPSVTAKLERQSLPDNTNGLFDRSRQISPPFKRRKVTPSDGQSSTSHYASTPSDDPRAQSSSSSSVETAIRSDVSHSVADPIQRQQSSISVKRERSPSPKLSLGPKAVTQGSIRHAPLPERCRRGVAHYSSNRKAWVAEQLKKMKDINPNIRATRVFTRDDGMVIDWESPVPIMSDTLLPAAPQHVPVNADGPAITAEIIDLDEMERSISRQQSSSRMQERHARPPTPVHRDHLIDGDISESAARTTIGRAPDRNGRAELSVSQSMQATPPEGPMPTPISEDSANVVAVGSRSPKLQNPTPTPVSASKNVAQTAPLSLPRRSSDMPPGSRAPRLTQRSPSVKSMNRESSKVDTAESVAPAGSSGQSESYDGPTNGQPRAEPSETPSDMGSASATGAREADAHIANSVASTPTAVPSEISQDRVPVADMTEQFKLEHMRGNPKPSLRPASHGLHLPRKTVPDASQAVTTSSVNARSVSPDPPQAVHPETGTPDVIANAPEVNSEAPSAAERELDAELKAAALQYLRRYIVTYDQDRSALASAYSRTATFSKQTIQCSGFDDLRVVHQPDDSPLKQGRLEIMASLLSLPDDRTFCVSGPIHLDFDVVSLGAAGGVLLMCHTGGHDEKWACDQRFVLRQKEWDEEDQSTEGLWPLIAVSHQMTIRERL